MNRNAEVMVTATHELDEIEMQVIERPGPGSYVLADAIEEAIEGFDIPREIYLECCNYEKLNVTIACDFPTVVPQRDHIVKRLHETLKAASRVDWPWCRRQARFAGSWAVSHQAPEWNSEVEFALVLCDSASVEDAIQAEYKEIQQERARSDAERLSARQDETVRHLTVSHVRQSTTTESAGKSP